MSNTRPFRLRTLVSAVDSRPSWGGLRTSDPPPPSGSLLANRKTAELKAATAKPTTKQILPRCVSEHPTGHASAHSDAGAKLDVAARAADAKLDQTRLDHEAPVLGMPIGKLLCLQREFDNARFATCQMDAPEVDELLARTIHA